MKQEVFGACLLLATSAIINRSPKEDAESFAQPQACKAADAVAEHTLMSSLKLLYSFLGSEKEKANAALHLLASIAQRGAKFVAELCQRFDFDLPALYKLARAPRYAAFQNAASFAFCLSCCFAVLKLITEDLMLLNTM